MSEDKACREIVNHEEAFALANLKRHESNLARCYLDLASRAAKPTSPNDLQAELVECKDEILRIHNEKCDWMWRAIDAESKLTAKPAVPEGWKLVPLEPTREMIDAAQECDTEGEDDPLSAWGMIYHALVDAAPPLPVAQGWISVKDRLPDDGQTVAFVVDCKNPNWDHLHGRVLGGLYLGTKNGGFSVPGLTVNAPHWMPLSAAPTPPAAPPETAKGDA